VQYALGPFGLASERQYSGFKAKERGRVSGEQIWRLTKSAKQTRYGPRKIKSTSEPSRFLFFHYFRVEHEVFVLSDATTQRASIPRSLIVACYHYWLLKANGNSRTRDVAAGHL